MIKYQTFDQLLNEVLDELELYDNNSLIEPSHLIPIVLKINKELGLRVTTTNQCIKDIENSIVKVPLNLQKINFILYLDEKITTIQNLPQGTHKDYNEIDLLNETDLKKEVEVTSDGFVYETIYTNGKPVFSKYKIAKQLELVEYTKFQRNNQVDQVCIKNNHLKTHLTSGKLMINYEGILEDEQGNLLVVDHPLLQDYYKYAIKRRILENLYFNGEESTIQKLQFIELRYIKAKQEANSVVDMPEFSEMKEIVELNRKANFIRYHSKFI